MFLKGRGVRGFTTANEERRAIFFAWRPSAAGANAHRAFTLIELLVVIAIIGLLSSVVLASLSTARSKSRDARRVADMKQIVAAVELYKDVNNNVAPPHGGSTFGCDTSTCLAVLTDELTPNYIPVIPLDPQYGNVGNYGYRYCRSSVNLSQYSVLLYNEATKNWCNVAHGSNVNVSGNSCWVTNGTPDHGWCHDEI